MQTGSPSLRFRHSGRLGDIIYSLPTIRALGGGSLYLNLGVELDEMGAQSLMSLLECQPYLEMVKLWEGEIFDVNLDAFRDNHPLRKNLADAHLTAFGLQPYHRDETWLSIPRQETNPQKRTEVIFARSILRPGVHGFWERVISVVGRRAAFVGTEAEHQSFCREFGDVRFAPTSDLLELSHLISSCKLFVGNQSCPYAIAEAIKKPSILEVDAKQPNCVFGRKSSLPISSSSDLENIEPFITSMFQDTEINRFLIAKNQQANQTPPTNYYENINHQIFDLVPITARRILDVGCAAGRLGEALKNHDSEREVWGVELVPAIAAKARDRLDQVIVGDIERMDPLPLKEGYFDCVICGDVLEHLRRPEDLLERLKRHLAPGATLLCNVPNISHWSVILELLHGNFPYEHSGLLDRTHLTFFTPRTFRCMTWDAGYAILSESPLTIEGEPVVNALATAAEQLGISPKITVDAMNTYQTAYVLKPHPDSSQDAEKKQLLLGPHVGKLGAGSGKRCSIIILTFNSEQTIRECLDSVLATSRDDDEIICVDNASSDRTFETLAEYVLNDQRIRLIKNDTNLGFSTGCNVGILASFGESIILLNPDTKVYDGWIEKLLLALAYPEAGAAGPVSDRVSGDQFVRFHIPADISPSNIDDLAEILHQTNRGSTVETKLLVGFCIAFPREVLDRAGLLIDAMFLGSDDLEVSWRLRTLGFRLYVVKDAFVHHETGQSQLSLDYNHRLTLSIESAAVLKEKLKLFYGTNHIDSYSLWGSAIFPL